MRLRFDGELWSRSSANHNGNTDDPVGLRKRGVRNSMAFEHACFISFPRDAGKASVFADCFYEELQQHLDVYDKRLSVFKYDRCEHRRRGDNWSEWIRRELCHSAMMVAVCAPAYFNGSEGCIAEFVSMERLVRRRRESLPPDCDSIDWIVGLRLKENVPIPRLREEYSVMDFFDCCATPAQVRKSRVNRRKVEQLADRIWTHWSKVTHPTGLRRLEAADLCSDFSLEIGEMESPDHFPHAGRPA